MAKGRWIFLLNSLEKILTPEFRIHAVFHANIHILPNPTFILNVRTLPEMSLRTATEERFWNGDGGPGE
jgi:hypothetical protein